MKFGIALDHLLNGALIKRESWDNLAVIYTPPAHVTIPESHHYQKAIENDEALIGGHFDLVTSDGTIQPGWLPGAGDLVAEDWVVTEQAESGEEVGDGAGETQ